MASGRVLRLCGVIPLLIWARPCEDAIGGLCGHLLKFVFACIGNRVNCWNPLAACMASGRFGYDKSVSREFGSFTVFFIEACYESRKQVLVGWCAGYVQVEGRRVAAGSVGRRPDRAGRGAAGRAGMPRRRSASTTPNNSGPDSVLTAKPAPMGGSASRQALPTRSPPAPASWSCSTTGSATCKLPPTSLPRSNGTA